MSHDHGHSHAGTRSRHTRPLLFALALTATFMVVEAVAGFLTGSLVLVADAGHMLTDSLALGFSVFAIRFAQRPATANKTYGYFRVEILVALLNSALLLGVAAYIMFEAYGRLTNPHDVPGLPLLLVATGGLAVNIISAALLMQGAKESLNVRGAFLEVMGDLLGSVGAILAGVILITTGWRYADPILAVAVSLLIVPRALKLMKDTLDILLEGAPSGVNFDDVVAAMLTVPGATTVHDLHIWTVSSGFTALSGHVTVADNADQGGILVALHRALNERFQIDHVTLQVETANLEEALGQPCLPGSPNCFAGPVSTSPTPDLLLAIGRKL